MRSLGPEAKLSISRLARSTLLSKIESQSRLSGCASIEWVAPKRFPVLDSSSRAQNACAFGSKRRTFQTYREWLLLVKRQLRFSFAAVGILDSASPALKPGSGSRLARRRKSPVHDSGAPRADTEPPSGSQNLKDLFEVLRTLRSSPVSWETWLRIETPWRSRFLLLRPRRCWKGRLFRCLNRQKDSNPSEPTRLI